MIHVVMISCEGREEITGDSMRACIERGGLDQSTLLNLHYFGRRASDAPKVDGWTVHHAFRKSMNEDFAAMLMTIPVGADVIFLEDDISPCKNALRFVAEYDVPASVGILSFFDFRGEFPEAGLFFDPPKRDLWGTQAVKIPAHVMRHMQSRAGEAISLNWDVWMSRVVFEMGLKVAHYSPTLFQHTGMTSIFAPGAKRPQSDTYPGDDYDALIPWVGPIVKGTWKERGPLRCSFHGGIKHPNGAVCPQVERAVLKKPRKGTTWVVFNDSPKGGV